jgi:hypothetical protein
MKRLYSQSHFSRMAVVWWEIGSASLRFLGCATNGGAVLLVIFFSLLLRNISSE